MAHEVNLGQFPDAAACRDAIHIAVAPAVAACELYPGQRVGLQADGTVGVCEPTIGIVDPYLPHKATKGERVWVLLYPQTITSLRHEWTHPAFDVQAPAPARSLPTRQEAQAWMEALAARSGASVEDLLSGARGYVERGDYAILGSGEFGLSEIYRASKADFWRAFEALTGVELDDDDRETVPFTCSC